MPADASIYSLIQPAKQQPGPLDNYGQVLQLRHLMDASSLNDLQRKQLEKSISEDEQASQAYRDAAGDPTKVRDLLYGRGLYKQGIAADKAGLEIAEKKGNIAKTEVDTKLKNWELGDKIHTENLQDLQGANDQAGWDRMRANVYERYARQIGPDEAARRIQSIPAVFDPNAKQSLLMTGLKTKEFLDMMKPDIKEVTDGQKKFFVDVNPKSNPDILKMNVKLVASPDALLADKRAREGGQVVTDGAGNTQIVNPFNKSATPVVDASGKPLEGKTNLTESQGKATGFSLRARESADIINGLEDKGTFGRVSGAKEGVRAGLERVPVVGTAAGNLVGGALNTVMSDAQQKYEQASRDFINAVLRVESGATITPSEFDNAYRQYFPQAGDSEATIEQKRSNREKAIEALKAQTGAGEKKVPAPRVDPKPAGKGGIKFLGFE